MKPDQIEVRPCVGLDELEMCVQLQLGVWGYTDSDTVPRKMFLVAQKIGGQVFGAFLPGAEERNTTTGNLVGFAMALPGYRNGHAYLHSHMLAVLPEHRNAGLGRWLKLAQRDDALARGIDLIEWTFDPLEIKNAHLNIEKLGAIARRYTPDFYGPSTSLLQGGLPTDRLHAEWWLRSSRVEHALGSHPMQPPPSGAAGPRLLDETVIVPSEMPLWKQSPDRRDAALEVQSSNRERFQRFFAAGLSVVHFNRDAEGNGVYHLGKWNEDLHY